MNGDAAHLIGEGEQIIVMGFELVDRPVEAKVAVLDASNRVLTEIVERPRTSVYAV